MATQVNNVTEIAEPSSPMSPQSPRTRANEDRYLAAITLNKPIRKELCASVQKEILPVAIALLNKINNGEKSDDKDAKHPVEVVINLVLDACNSVLNGRRKEARDPRKPRKPTSAFFAYQNSIRAAAIEQHGWDHNTFTVESGALWKSLTDAEKKPYLDNEKESKQKYEQELVAYNQMIAEENAANGDLPGASDDEQMDGVSKKRKTSPTKKTRATPATITTEMSDMVVDEEEKEASPNVVVPEPAVMPTRSPVGGKKPAAAKKPKA